MTDRVALFPKKRHSLVTVEVPQPLAEALINYGDELIEALRGERGAAQEQERQAREAMWDANVREIDVWRIQACRRIRRERLPGENVRDACRRLLPELKEAHPFGHTLDAVTLQGMYTGRHQKVKAYLEERRAVAAARLSAAGWRNKEIAPRIGLTNPSGVTRLLKRYPRAVADVMRGGRGRTLPGEGHR